MIYVLCWVFTLINGIGIIAVGPVNASLSLVLLATITARLQVIYFYGRSLCLRARSRGKLQRVFLENRQISWSKAEESAYKALSSAWWLTRRRPC